MTKYIFIATFTGLFLINACTFSQQKNSVKTTTDSLKQKTTLVKNALTHLANEQLVFSAMNKGDFLGINTKSRAIATKYKDHPKLRVQINTLHKQTFALLQELQKVKNTLIKRAGGGLNVNTNTVMTPMVIDEVYNYMISEKTAYSLEKKLNAFNAFLNQKYEFLGIPKLPLIAMGNQRNPLYENQPDKQKKDFAHAYFQNTPVIIALTYLTHFQNVVLRYEEEVIKYLILSLVGKK